MKQTAMQMHIEWLKATIEIAEEHAKPTVNALKLCLSDAEQRLAMEKDQIIECCVQTTKDCWVALMEEFGEKLNFCEEDLTTINEEAEQYYEKTYGK